MSIHILYCFFREVSVANIKCIESDLSIMFVIDFPSGCFRATGKKYS